MSQKKPKNLPDKISLSKHRKSGKSVSGEHFTGKGKQNKKKRKPSSTTRKQRKTKRGSHKNKY